MVAVTTAASPFAAARLPVAPGVELTRLAPFEAAQLGIVCASMDPWARYGLSASDLGAFLAREEAGAARFGVRIDGQLEGALVVKPDWFSGPYIQLLALARGAQGRGAGSKLIAFIEAAGRAQKSRNLWVAASDFNSGAIRFYERHGFVRFALADGLLRNDRDEVLLRKKLFSA